MTGDFKDPPRSEERGDVIGFERRMRVRAKDDNMPVIMMAFRILSTVKICQLSTVKALECSSFPGAIHDEINLLIVLHYISALLSVWMQSLKGNLQPL